MSAPEHKSAGGPLASILALPNDDPKKTLFVAIAVCLVCSVVVAAAAIGLRPLQAANQERDRIRNIVEVAGVRKAGPIRGRGLPRECRADSHPVV